MIFHTDIKLRFLLLRLRKQVTKYGEEIGIATTEITAGEHVHIHNIDSIRGRGDWVKEGDR